MANKKRSRSRSRSNRTNKNVAVAAARENRVVVVAVADEETKLLSTLMEAFSLSSPQQVASAYKEANGDLNRAAEILGDFDFELSEDDDLPSSLSTSSLIESSTTSSSLDFTSTSSSINGSSSSSTTGSSSSSDGLVYVNAEIGKGFGNIRGNNNNKGKKVVAATGMVSVVLGKDYSMKVSPRKDKDSSIKGFHSHGLRRSTCQDNEDAEQFLYSMLGDECQLNMQVVRDVFCNCGYDIEKALDIMLELSSSSHEPLRTNHGSYFADEACYPTSLLSECEVGDNVQYKGLPTRSYASAVVNPETRLSSSLGRTKSNLSQTVLESLFNVSKIVEHEPGTMDWRNVAKKMKSLGQGFDHCPSGFDEQKKNYVLVDKGNEYQMFRESANQHWNSMASYYQRAATAYSNGQRSHAAYLSDQGKLHTKRAQDADDKASQEIFQSRNKSIENVITIDMHGQHVKQAMRLLKLHLLFGTYVSSIQILRVITGTGSHGLGKSKVKQAVISLMERENIKWSEENQGTVLVKLEGKREFSFLDIDSDPE